jgi:cell fate (sporulation/competence/biofilm development) regulator YlbF (YheA/YmcA/DUF963 family)
MANSLEDVRQTFVSLDQQYSMLRLACKTDDDRKALAAKYEQAQANYEAVGEKILSDDDIQVAALSAQLKAANKQVAKLVEQMGDISKVIDGITQAVTVGAQLLAKV